MMFLILDKSPVESIKYLLRNTNKKYLAKQVLEAIEEYKKYLKWKIETNPKYFKGDIND